MQIAAPVPRLAVGERARGRDGEHNRERVDRQDVAQPDVERRRNRDADEENNRYDKEGLAIQGKEAARAWRSRSHP